jgi:hypothetical protein
MNQDIINWAREAGFVNSDAANIYQCLYRFAALVAAAEREHCAKVCESLFDLDDDSCSEAEQCAAAIRARSNP